MKLKASLEAVRSRKDVSDNIVQTIILNVYGSADQMGELNSLFRKPLEIEVKEVS